MAPPKKAAKKTMMKAAKKAAKKSPHHKESRDIRRAYEHLGRVEILQKASGVVDNDTSTLLGLAQRELNSGSPESAADILRAAEHLSFASLGAFSSRSAGITPALKRELLAEVDHLTTRTREHADDDGERYPELVDLVDSMLGRAADAVRKTAYRQALELARGAEALSHVLRHSTAQLAGGHGPRHLR